MTAIVAALQVLEIIEPALAGAIRRALLADAELAVALLTPIAVMVTIMRRNDESDPRRSPRRSW